MFVSEEGEAAASGGSILSLSEATFRFVAQEEDPAAADAAESMESGSGEEEGEAGTPSPSAERKPLSFKAAARVATVRFCYSVYPSSAHRQHLTMHD